MSSSTAISVRGLGKRYTIAVTGTRRTTLADTVVHRLRHPLQRSDSEDFWALRDLSFAIEPGEAVGVIGRNGAGKSTLLKILSRITEPTAGEVHLRGRVGCLLEVGTGFHPELTGRENIFLNGAILGMKRRDIARQFDAIVEFSGVERFLDTPVKRFSSGMLVRLAFAVAAHLEPEILVVDEVLAVGDAEFQKRCLGKMSEVASQDARTVLFVSHNMAAIEALCSRCIYLEAGRIAFDGSPSQAISRYLTIGGGQGITPGEFELAECPCGHHRGRPMLRHLRLNDSTGAPCDRVQMREEFSITVEVDGLDALARPQVGMDIRSERDQLLATVHTRMRPPESDGAGDAVRFSLHDLPLAPGRYWLDVGVGDVGEAQAVDMVHRAGWFDVSAGDIYGSGHEPSARDGMLFIDFNWEVTEPYRTDSVP